MTSMMDEVAKAHDLLETGAITEAEFSSLKASLLGNTTYPQRAVSGSEDASAHSDDRPPCSTDVEPVGGQTNPPSRSTGAGTPQDCDQSTLPKAETTIPARKLGDTGRAVTNSSETSALKGIAIGFLIVALFLVVMVVGGTYAQNAANDSTKTTGTTDSMKDVGATVESAFGGPEAEKTGWMDGTVVLDTGERFTGVPLKPYTAAGDRIRMSQAALDGQWLVVGYE